MPAVILFTSTQACAPVLHLALDMQATNGYQLRTLRQLPPPRPVRVAALQLELAALYQIERTIRWVLGQYAAGLRLPDAQRESDLRADLDVTLWQIDQALGKIQSLGDIQLVEGGQGNG